MGRLLTVVSRSPPHSLKSLPQPSAEFFSGALLPRPSLLPQSVVSRPSAVSCCYSHTSTRLRLQPFWLQSSLSYSSHRPEGAQQTLLLPRHRADDLSRHPAITIESTFRGEMGPFGVGYLQNTLHTVCIRLYFHITIFSSPSDSVYTYVPSYLWSV